MQFSKLKWNNW